MRVFISVFTSVDLALEEREIIKGIALHSWYFYKVNSENQFIYLSPTLLKSYPSINLTYVYISSYFWRTRRTRFFGPTRFNRFKPIIPFPSRPNQHIPTWPNLTSKTSRQQTPEPPSSFLIKSTACCCLLLKSSRSKIEPSPTLLSSATKLAVVLNDPRDGDITVQGRRRGDVL